MFGHNSTGFGWGKKGVAQNLGQTIALNHYNRVTAAGGVLPCGVAALAAIINAICTALGLTTEAQFNAAVPEGLDPHYSGYLGGAGSGVTLGQACQKIFNWAGATGDVSQGTAGSMPLLLAHTSGQNYFWNSNVAGNSCSAPKSLTQTDTLDFVAKIDFTNYSGYAVASVDNSSTSRNFYITYGGGGNFFGLIYGSGLTQNVLASVPSADYNGWFKVTLQKSGANSIIRFYKSEQSSITDYSLVTWAQIGTDVVGTYAAMTTASSFFNILSGGSSSNSSRSKCYYAHISETIGGAPLAVFNPNTYNAATSQTQWTSTTGETWTLNVGTEIDGLKACIVDRTIVQSNGTTHSMDSGTITSRQYFTSFSAAKLFEYTAEQPIYSTSSNKHILYTALGSLTAYNNSNLVSGNTSLLLNCQTVDFNDTSSKIRVNAGADVSGSSGNASSTSVVLFVYSTVFGNCQFNTLIQLSSIATNTQKTAMYNVIRSMNNNAF